MSKSKYDWDAIRTEYITGESTIRELSAKYGPAKAAIQKKSARDGWTAAKEKYRVTATNHREKALAINKAKNDLKGLEIVGNEMEDEMLRVSVMLKDEHLSTQNRYNLMRCLEIANRLYKDSRGILSKAEEDRLAMARAELKMKQEEHEKNMAERTIGSEPIKVIFSTEIEGDSE